VKKLKLHSFVKISADCRSLFLSKSKVPKVDHDHYLKLKHVAQNQNRKNKLMVNSAKVNDRSWVYKYLSMPFPCIDEITWH